jgi:hypothetical protein
MSEFTDELRDLANEQDAGPNGPEFKKALRIAADMLEEAENALVAYVEADCGEWQMTITQYDAAMEEAYARAAAILARLREPR